MRAEGWLDARQAGRQVPLKLRNGNNHMRGFYIALQAALFSFAALAPFHVNAQNIVQLGYGRLVNNDFLGDLKDRGQTGSYVTSRIYGKSWGAHFQRALAKFWNFARRLILKHLTIWLTRLQGIDLTQDH
jgi:hypothetical protein